jgi:hypothetical protein
MRYVVLGAVTGMVAGALLDVVLTWRSGSTYEWLDSLLGTAPMGLLPGVALGAVVMSQKQSPRRWAATASPGLIAAPTDCPTSGGRCDAPNLAGRLVSEPPVRLPGMIFDVLTAGAHW